MYDGSLWETTAREIETKRAARDRLAGADVYARGGAKYE
jgi:hypothetical protein